MKLDELKLFTDGSVDPQSKVGYGAFLAVSGPVLSEEVLRPQVKLKKFDQTSSAKLELQTLLWALGKFCASGRKIVVYTDSQTIVGLQGRRHRLELNDYCSRKGTPIHHHELYKEFYRMMDVLGCEVVKVAGHKKSGQKNEMDRLFTLVDRASRNALRKTNLSCL